MHRTATVILVAAVAIAGAAMFQPPPGGLLAQPGPGAAPAGAAVDSFAAERDSMMKAVLGKITGLENVAAESVFKNIKSLKGMPAGRVVRIMNMGYGKSLGVRCAHCHDPEKWDSDDKPQKQIARDMHAMVGKLNGELLPAIKNLKSERPGVNCTTCHRGQRKPAQNM